MSERSGSTTLSVADLAQHIAEQLQQAFPNDIWVRGQIHNITRPASGHVYFTLVDTTATSDAAGSPNAGPPQLRVMLHSRDKTRVNRLLTRAGGGVRMVDGTEVRIRVRVDFYSPRGDLQLRMASIDPAFTLGQMAVARAELIDRLKADGIFDANRQRPMPLAPLRIGLVTSRGSAAEADVLHELLGSGYAFEIEVADVRVQGADAPDLLARAIHTLGGEDIDALIVARGGGATTDLAAYDTELVARAVAECPRPVICGVGHEIDRSVTDEVAFYSGKTPTAAAHYLVALVADAEERAERAFAAIGVAGRRGVELAAAQIERCRARANAAARSATRSERRRIDALDLRFRPATQRRLQASTDRVDRLSDQLAVSARSLLARRTATIDMLAALTAASDPARALARGWSITRRSDGTVVRSIADVVDGATLETALADGTVTSTVESTKGS